MYKIYTYMRTFILKWFGYLVAHSWIEQGGGKER